MVQKVFSKLIPNTARAITARPENGINYATGVIPKQNKTDYLVPRYQPQISTNLAIMAQALRQEHLRKEKIDLLLRQPFTFWTLPPNIIMNMLQMINNTDKIYLVREMLTYMSSVANVRYYLYLKDPPNVGKRKNFTKKQKEKIIHENKKRNNGVIKSDRSGEVLERPQKSKRGVTPLNTEYQIDHIIPKDKGGTNSYSNAQVLSRKENRKKSNK